MLLQVLPITSLNITDDSFRMCFAPRLERLTSSIKTIGVVQPIVVRHTVDGAYQIVAGYRRVVACQALGRQTIPALVYDHSALPVFQAFLHNLHDNLATRGLNLIEEAHVLERLLGSYGIPEDDLVKTYLPLMEEDASYRVLHQLLSLMQCAGPAKTLIVEKRYALSTAARIAEFSPNTQEGLVKVLRPLRATPAKLNDLLVMIREIAARDAVSVEDVLERYQLLAVVIDPSVAPPAKVEALRKTLQGVRMPTLMERQQQFASLIRDLALPQTAKLTADPYFEDPRIKLEYQFKAPEELETLINQLQQAFDRQSWRKIFEWYRV